jgi:hypothetical protein
MRMPAARPALLLLAILLAATAEAAPAPVYKERPSLESAHRALPKALRDEIEWFQRSNPGRIEGNVQASKRVRTEKEKLACLLGAEHHKRAYYAYPVQYLEYQRKQPDYASREDQAAIETALKFYRIQYADAKKRGLFKIPNLEE